MDDIPYIPSPNSGRGIGTGGKELGLVKLLEKTEEMKFDKEGKYLSGEVPVLVLRKFWSLFSKDTRLANKDKTDDYITAQLEQQILIGFIESDDPNFWEDPSVDPLLEYANVKKLAHDISTRNKDGMERKQLDTTASYTMGETHISEGQAPRKGFLGGLASKFKL